MPVDLRTPILAERLKAVNFFNGRLVSGEDMTDEQNAHRAAHELLGTVLGDGVAHGLEVEEASSGSTAEAPVLHVGAGLAVNRCGEVLRLSRDADVRLVRSEPKTSPSGSVAVFRTCTPPQGTPPLVDEAVYLLTISSSRAGGGKTNLDATPSLPTRCKMRWIVDAVEFHLIDVHVSSALTDVPGRLRNRIAYACFGTDARRDFSINPFGALRRPPTLLDGLRGGDLTDCDVPLAIVQWKANTGLAFVDVWSVRRRCTFGSEVAGEIAFSDRAAPLAEAMFNQFGAQIEELGQANPASVEARRRFRYLPPAGLLPVSSGASIRFDYERFFAGKTCSRPRHVEAGDVEAVLRESVDYPPVDLDDEEMVWIYFVHENRAAGLATAAGGVAAAFALRPAVPAFPGAFAPPHYVLFTNVNLPFFGNARLNRSHFDFANFV